MATRTALTALRVVIDTNVLVSALVFKSGALAALREAWQSGDCVPVVSRATTEELLTVLRYPKFALGAVERESILIAYLPYCETLPDPRTRVKLPQCRDEDDQIFLLLAVAGKVDALITGDRDLLALRGAVACPMLTPAEFLARSSKK